MADKFDVSAWRAEVAAWWRDRAGDLPGAARRLGVQTAYGLLAASAWLPLLAAYGNDPGPAVAALAGVLGGVGTNLISNLVQGTYDRATAPQQAEREVAESPGLRAEYQQMLAALDVVAAAREALGETWPIFEADLRQELSRLGGELRIDSGGGAVVLGSVMVRRGDFVGRDQVVYGDKVYGVGGEELARLFADVYERIEARPPDPDVDKEELAATVQKVEEEVAQGEEANPRKVERWLRFLGEMAPDILDVTVACLTHPLAGVGTVIRKVAEKARAKAG